MTLLFSKKSFPLAIFLLVWWCNQCNCDRHRHFSGHVFLKKELDFSNLIDEYLTTDARCPGARYCCHGLGSLSVSWRAETVPFFLIMSFLEKFNPISFVSLSRPIFLNYLIPNLHYFMKMRVIHTCCHSQIRLRIRPVYTCDGPGTYWNRLYFVPSSVLCLGAPNLGVSVKIFPHLPFSFQR